MVSSLCYVNREIIRLPSANGCEEIAFRVVNRFPASRQLRARRFTNPN